MNNWYGNWLPSPSSLHSATSPKGRGKMFSRVLLPFRHSLRSATSPKGRGKMFSRVLPPSGTRCARPPLPKGEARGFPGYFPLRALAALGHLSQGERQYVSRVLPPSGTRCARPPLPRGEARDACAGDFYTKKDGRPSRLYSYSLYSSLPFGAITTRRLGSSPSLYVVT